MVDWLDPARDRGTGGRGWAGGLRRGGIEAYDLAVLPDPRDRALGRVATRQSEHPQRQRRKSPASKNEMKEHRDASYRLRRLRLRARGRNAS